MDTKPINDWMNAWRAFQQPPGMNPWAASVDQFWRNALDQSSMDPAFQSVLQRLIDQSKGVFDLGQQFSARVQPEAETDWTKIINEVLDQMSGQFRNLEGLTGPWHTMFNTWEQFSGQSAGQLAGLDQNSLQSWLKMPGVGLTREHQESLQELSKLWLDYEQAQREYGAYMSSMGQQAIERTRSELSDKIERGEGPETVREFYNEWIRCSEQVYAEHALSDDYMSLHGRLVNTLMAYKRHLAGMIDDWAQAVNLPSRQEMDALHRKLREAQRNLRTTHAELSALTRKVEELSAASKPKSKKTSGKGSRKSQKKKRKSSK